MSTETTCTCPSGDGSLRWPCPAHPPHMGRLHQHLLDMLGAKDHVDAGRIIGELHAAALNEHSGNSGQLAPDAGSGGDARAQVADGVLPPLPIAFFDEFGCGADDRVQDYARAAIAARQPGQVGTVIGWRMIDGVTVFGVATHSGIVEPQQFVRYADYLAARHPVGDVELRRALEQIERWELPETGETWPSGGALSYEAAHGSNGVRDYIRSVARQALAYAPHAAVPVDGLRESQILAKDHDGMRVSYSGLMRQARGALTRGSADPALAEMLRQLEKHMEELGKRWYAGDRLVVDELLQLYCIETNARHALLATYPQPAVAGGDA